MKEYKYASRIEPVSIRVNVHYATTELPYSMQNFQIEVTLLF